MNSSPQPPDSHYDTARLIALGDDVTLEELWTNTSPDIYALINVPSANPSSSLALHTAPVAQLLEQWKPTLNVDIILQIIERLVERNNNVVQTRVLLINQHMYLKYVRQFFQHLTLNRTVTKRVLKPLFPSNKALNAFLCLPYADVDTTTQSADPHKLPIYKESYFGNIEGWIGLLWSKFERLYEFTEVLTIEDAVSLKYLAAFLATALEYLLQTDSEGHKELSFKFRVLPRVNWVIYPKSFAYDRRAVTASPRQRTMPMGSLIPPIPYAPIDCALYTVSRCLFSPNRCVYIRRDHHERPQLPLPASDLNLYHPSWDRGYSPTTRHLVMHNVELDALTASIVAEHLEFFLCRMEKDGGDTEYETGDEADNGMMERSWRSDYEEEEMAWHADKITSWINGFFSDSDDLFDAL
ncbi:hypothetical protein B9479_007921 [Cryptococcus floricola]|uniref:Uncharacterized protein n=1 Tax=Cryptococcus floricola TaxID=2591691 RepID=A0A5D3AN59_9TREE|nr:hypothetical protein B9479_007921 [Cryptococcus floricola]